MRGHLLPYVLFLASVAAFGWLLRGAGEAGMAAAVALGLLVWWWAGNRSNRRKTK